MPKYDFSDFDEAKPQAKALDFSDFEEPAPALKPDAMAQALASSPEVVDAARHPLDALGSALKGQDSASYADMVAAAKGEFTDSPEAAAAKERVLANTEGMALGNLNFPGGAGVAQGLVEAARGVGRGIEGAAESLRGPAESLAARALGAERGTVKKLGIDEVRKAGRYGLDSGVVTPLASAEEMSKRNEVMKRLAGKRMGGVYEAIDEKGASKFNPLDVATKVEQELSPTYKTPINKSEWAQMNNTIESILSRGAKPLPLAEAQKLKEEIGSVAYPKGKRALDPSPKQLMAMDAYRIVNQSIDEATEAGANAIGSKKLADELKAAKKMFSSASGAEKLLDNRVAREQGNKLMGLTDWIATGAGIGGGMVEPSALPYALAAVGAKKGLEKFGSASAAVALDRASKLLAATPQKLGKFGPTLQKAMERGETAYFTTHKMLMNDPEYRKLLESEGEQ